MLESSSHRARRPQGLFTFENFVLLIVLLLGIVVFSGYAYANPENRFREKISILVNTSDQDGFFEVLTELSELPYSEVSDALIDRIVTELNKETTDKTILDLAVEAFSKIAGKQEYRKLDQEVNVRVLSKISEKNQKYALAEEVLMSAKPKNPERVLISLEKLRKENAEQKVVSLVPENPKKLEEFLVDRARAIVHGNDDEVIMAAKQLAKTPYVDVLKVLTHRLAQEVHEVAKNYKDPGPLFMPDTPEASWENTEKTTNVAQALINALWEIGSETAFHHAKRYLSNALVGADVDLKVEKEVLKASGTPEFEVYFAKLQLILARFKAFSGKPAINLGHRSLDIYRLTNVMPEEKEPAAEVAQRVKTFLADKVVGQEPIIEELKNMELLTALYKGDNPRPETMLLMNARGTGIQYVLKSYVDAIHGYAGAHEDYMYTIEPITDRTDRNRVTGSNSGYLGSDQQSPFIHFLVLVSGGRYLIESDEKKERVIENPNWEKGDVFIGTTSPKKALLHLSGLESWSANQAYDFLKSASSGVWEISAPNGGVSKINVPVRVIGTTTEGSDLLVPKNPITGIRDGLMSTDEQILERYNLVKNNRTRLEEKLLESNSMQGHTSDPDTKRGWRREAIRLFDRIFLASPYTPEQKFEITKRYLEDYSREKVGNFGRGGFSLQFDNALIEYIHRFEYNPEEQTSTLEQKVKELVVYPILSLLSEGSLNESDQKRTLKLSFDVSDDHTAKLNVEVQETGQKVSKLVQATERLRDRQPLPDSEIDRLNNLDKEAAQYVVGVDEILTEIRKAVVPMRDGRGKHLTVDTARDPPFVIMLLGLTSTGKTQTPKAIAKVLFGSDRAFVNLGFGGATSAQEVKNLIFGYKEGGQVFESEFIKAHRATGGQMIVNLDELANVKDPNWLYPLYDLLREATAGGFIRPDGTTGSLVMSNIIFVITGNATQEFWARVPNHLPLDVQMLAYSEIARNLRERPSMVRDSLENIFPKALLARVKSYRTFVVSPHTYKSIRQLTHLKVLEAIRNIGTGTGKRTWKLTFPDHNEYLKIVELIERDGFQITEQGASIDGYVDRLFSNEILARRHRK